jgi:two-component system, OmpR family, sensor histidine kinase KdpD
VLAVAGAVALATLLVALLDDIAPITGLNVIYLLAVLFVAIRYGQVAALVTAVASVLTMNFFFIEPRYRLTVNESEQLVALVVFLVTAVVVGRLAADARERAEESEVRAAVADAREREAAVLAEIASEMLVGGSVEAELAGSAKRLSGVVGAPARIELAGAPSPAEGERTVRLPVRSEPAWLHVGEGEAAGVVDRLTEPLARLIDVGIERRRVSERVAESEALRRAEVAKTAVLHAVSHDLRSPLTAIVTAGSGLRTDSLSDGDRAELLSVLETESRRLTRLVEDLLDLSRIEAGAVDPRQDWCDLRDVVSRASEQVRASHPDRRIEIELPDDLPLIRADAVQMGRVFFNLVENAVKFSPNDAPVTVTGGAGPSDVTVRVKDRGPGVPPGRRQEVFEPFFHGRGEHSGSGLGLAISRGFVEANGGRIALQTRRGEGTAFAITFPLAERAPVEA